MEDSWMVLVLAGKMARQRHGVRVAKRSGDTAIAGFVTQLMTSVETISTASAMAVSPLHFATALHDAKRSSQS
jgi:hypothetical protein